jgi:hypothetical protein
MFNVGDLSLKWHYEVFRWFDLYVGKDNDVQTVKAEKVYH